MRSNRARVVALALVAVMTLPMLPAELLGYEDSALAQGGSLAGLLPQGVGWQDWQATHQMFIHNNNVDGSEIECPVDPQTGDVFLRGDRQCPLPMDTRPVPANVPDRITKTLADPNELGGDQPLGLPNSKIAWMRLEPPITHPMRVNGLSVKIWVSATTLTSCELTPQTGELEVDIEVRALPSGDDGTENAGQTIGRTNFKQCPVTLNPNCVVCPITADIPVSGGVQLLAEQRLQLLVAIGRQVTGTWTLEYDGQTADSHLTVRSPDAFQFAAWLEDKERKVTTIFPVPGGAGDRNSVVGFFGFKTAFGGYDNPPVQSNPPLSTDAKWTMKIRAPDGTLVSLRDPVFPLPEGHDGEFKDCENHETDFETCLDQTSVSTDSPPSAKVFRLPSKPVLPGSSHIWNYTIDRINQIAPGGGEFKLEIFGQGRKDIPIETRLPDGIRFTVGGFGVRLAPLRVGVQEETLSHTVRPGQPTTFLLNISNVSPKQDNFTLTSAFDACNPSNIPCSNWGIAFSGRDVRGGNTATLEGFNSSILKVTITPPAGALAANLRVSARSISAPDQKNESLLNVQVSSTLNRGVGVFVGPEPSEKQVRRNQQVTFNYTIWNRGTDLDSFSVNCDTGPDLTLKPDFTRNDDTWNGTISLGGNTIGCKDINATRVLTTTIPPGDTREAVVTLEASANATARREMRVIVKAESQGDSSKVERGSATAFLETVRSFKMSILTDGQANPDDPQSPVQASRTMRFGKDDNAVCPSPSNPGNAPCGPGDNTENLYTQDWNSQQQSPPVPVVQQRLDTNFTEFAFYRITVVNDGDEEAALNLRMAEVKNTTLTTPGGTTCGPGDNSFDSVAKNVSEFSMQDLRGVLLLNRPIYSWPVDPASAEEISVLRVPAGKSGVFYLRVHHEWNRMNLSVLNAGGGIAVDGPVCNGESRITVQATAENFPSQSVVAITQAFNDAQDSSRFTKNVVLTQGVRLENNLIEADSPQSCPPVTPPDSGDRVLCKYIKPGQILPGCSCSVSWFFTASKFWGLSDDFAVKALRRVGGFSLTDLINRGWRFSGPRIIEENLGKSANVYAAGDEIKLQVDVTVPGNATVNDFAGLQVDVGTVRGSPSTPLSFYTVGAQKFKLNVTNLGGLAPIEIHPGDRAAINLNISNEGAAVDVYNITVPTALPPGYAPFFQPNETRVSPSRNKTVTVFIQSPTVGQFPQTVTGTIRVSSVVNLSAQPGETTAEVPFTVVVRDRIADNVQLVVSGIETKPIDNGGSVTFALNVSNPAPNEKKFTLRRLPARDLVRQFVDGWTDFVGEECFDVAARGTKQVSFSVTAPVDALEGTHVTWVLRVDEANAQCQPLTQNPNFAQGLVTTTVIGQVGLEVQPLDPVKVVPRGGNVSLPVRIRNVGTAGDTFVFQTRFVNESQSLPPNPWSVDVRTSEGQQVQTLLVDPQTSRIVFVNVQAPLNIPVLGVRSDVEFNVRGTEASPASVRLTAFVQDYDIRVRITNATVDAAPGQVLFFVLNMTNAGNGIDTHDIVVDIGGLAGYWNVTSEFAAVTLLNGTSKDVLITVQVPRTPLPTTGAVIGITVRSRQVEAMRPAAEALGAGSPLVAYLNTVPKTALLSVNLFPYVSFDVDGDREPEIAVDRNRNSRDGFEVFQDPFTAIIQSVSLLGADGDGDGRLDHFVDIDLDGRPERYWDPDDIRITAIGGSVSGAAGSANEAYPDVNNDGTLEFLFDSDADLAIDHWIDPATRRTGEVIEKDFDDDGNPEWLIDTNEDGRPDKYFDADRGPRGLVTNVEPAPGGNPQQYAIDTTGQGRPTKVYDRVTGEVTTASFSSVGAFFADFWYLILLFIAVAVLAGYLVYNQRKAKPPPQG